MRILITASVICVLSFAAGVMGDLSPASAGDYGAGAGNRVVLPAAAWIVDADKSVGAAKLGEQQSDAPV